MLCATLVAAVALPLALTGCGESDESSSSDPNKPVELAIMWWGGEARAKLTAQALDLYTKKHPNGTFKKTWQANQGYNEKLATLIAGNSTPDIFQVDDNYLTEYKNKLSAVAWAENTQCLVYNKTALDKAGVVVDVINFLVNDKEAGTILGTERGLPSDPDIRNAVAASVTDPNMKASIAIENELGKQFGDAPAVPIKGHSNVRRELTKAAEKVQFGQATPAKAAEEYLAAAKAAIDR